MAAIVPYRAITKTGGGGALVAAKKGGAQVSKTLVNIEKVLQNKIKDKKKFYDKQSRITRLEGERKTRTASEATLEKASSFRMNLLGKVPNFAVDAFARIMNFLGIYLIGWITDKLPKIINAIQDANQRIQKMGEILTGLVRRGINIVTAMGGLIAAKTKQIATLDFGDKSGDVKKAQDKLDKAFDDLQDDWDQGVKLLTAPLGSFPVSDGNGGGEFDGELSGDAVERTKQLLRSSEGFREKAYWDVNAWRIGYGTDTITDAQGNVTSVTKDSVVTREDAERDLERRIRTGFMPKVAGQVGDNWTKLPANAQAALTSVGYNYGSLPQSVVAATRGGNLNDIADAVEALKTHDKGVNARRRMEEAAIIRKSASPGAGDGKARRQKNQTPAYQQAVKVGRSLESQGYRAWQHPDFSVFKGYTGSGMERVMRRSYNSYHNYGEALDFPLSHNTEAQLNKLAKYFSDNRSRLGVAELKWKDDANHFDHLHVSFKGGGSGGMLMATGPDPTTGLAPAPATSNFDMAKFRKYLAEAMAQQQQQVAQPKQQSQESSGPSAPQMMNPTSNLNSMLFTALSFV